jgi:hypothetical protein
MSGAVENTEWNRRIVQILSLDPDNRRRVLKILLDHASEGGLSEESQLILRDCSDDLKASEYLRKLKNNSI